MKNVMILTGAGQIGYGHRTPDGLWNENCHR